MIADQALVTYQGTWEPTQTIGANDIVSAVNTALSKDGLAVRDFSSTAGFSQNTWPFTLNLAPFQVTLKLQVQNGLGFASPDDITSIIRHEVFVVTGKFPDADTVPMVQNPGQIFGTSTGQGTQQQGGPQPQTSLWDSIKKLFGNTELVIVGAGLGLVLAVLLIANPRKIL